MSLADIDLFELNEAFAAQVIACERGVEVRPGPTEFARRRHLGRAPDRDERARILLTLAYQMRDRDVALGLATLCISGGQGLAVVLERTDR